MKEVKRPKISIVIPLYNEAEVFDELRQRLEELMKAFELCIEVVMVDDGSADLTAEKMRKLSMENENFQSVFLSRNFGHQIALTAGLRFAQAQEAIMLMDADLQDPPEMIHKFYEHLKQGYDVVYAVRSSRQSTFLMKIAYSLFYRAMKRFSYINIPLDSGDFAMISRRVADHINAMPEESRFIRGMRSWVGFRQIGISHDREERKSGNSKYSLKNLISLALNGLFNFSKYPIRFTVMLGLVALSLSLAYFLITFVRKFVIGDVPSGFTALLFTIILFGGLQLIAIGIIGEYVLRIFFQVKNRPLYIVKERIKNGETIIE
jgi:glycosyltransferase involved in cell wall biosynthesis